MKAKRRLQFAYFWNGLVYLNDGSEWRLADPSRRRDVIWWQSGETVRVERHRNRIELRNLSRAEQVPLEAVDLIEWQLAA